MDSQCRPDPVRGIEQAKANGWLEATPGSQTFAALTICHAWVYAGGSIAQKHYKPTFSVDTDDPKAILCRSLDEIDCGHDLLPRNTTKRSMEIVPAEFATLLGRYLHGVRGAPVGAKNRESPRHLPDWITRAPIPTRRRWVRSYVCVRGSERDDGVVQLSEQRHEFFREELLALINSVLGGPDESAKISDGSGIYIDTSGDITVPPMLPYQR
jgi:hypothetical protein